MTEAQIEAAIYAILFGFPIGALFGWLFIERNIQSFADFRDRVFFALRMRSTGLKAIYPMSHPASRSPLKNILKNVRPGDEILFAGRTHVHVLEQNSEAMSAALAAGACLRFVLLDRNAIGRPGEAARIDLRLLGQSVTRGKLAADVSHAEDMLKHLRDKCLSDKYRGSLLVYRTDVLIQNSATIYQPRSEKKRLEIVFDLSMGESTTDKFVNYYKTKASPDSFCSKLRSYYYDLIKIDRADLADLDYALSYTP